MKKRQEMQRHPPPAALATPGLTPRSRLSEKPRKGCWRGKDAGLRPSAQPTSSVLNRMRDAMMGDDSDGMPVFNVFARWKKAKVLLTIESLCAHLLASLSLRLRALSHPICSLKLG